MADKNPRGEDDEFERRWQALTDELGDLEVPSPSETTEPDAAARPGHTARADGWGGDEGGAPARGPRDYEVAADDEEHFSPPDPEIRPGTDPLLTLAWILVGVGAIGALVTGVLYTVLAAFWIQLSCGVLAIGLVLVFLRLPRRDREADDDSGAQV